MDRHILALLRLFEGRVPDAVSHSWVLALASDRDKWSDAHLLFSKIRKRNLEAINAKDIVCECQYGFEEACLKSLYNETGPFDPFDYDSPYYIAPNALALARYVGVPVESVVGILSPTDGL